MTDQEAHIAHLETCVDDLLAGNRRLREERDQAIVALRRLTHAAAAVTPMLLEDPYDSELSAIVNDDSWPRAGREFAAAILAARATLRVEIRCDATRAGASQ